MVWFSPTGHNDPGSEWQLEEDAYDDNLTTAAECDNVPAQSWCDYLELTLDSPIVVSKVRFNELGIGDTVPEVDIDVYSDPDWYHVYQGTYQWGVWIEKDIPGGSKTITKARIRFYNDSLGLEGVRLWEFDFGVVPKAPGYNDCVGLWRMNDNDANTTVVDSSGKGNDGEAQQNTDQLSVAGKIKTALSFDPVIPDYIDVDDGNHWQDVFLNNWTISLWFNMDVLDTDQALFTQYFKILCYLRSNNLIRIKLTDKTDTTVNTDTSGTMTASTQIHLVITYGNDTVTLYIDGNFSNDNTVEGPLTISDSVLRIGRYGSIYPFDGKMDCITLFNKKLSIEEIAWLWNDGNGRENLGAARPLVGGSLASDRKGLV